MSNLNSGQWEELEEIVSSRAGDQGAGWSVGLGLGTLGGQHMEQVWPGREEACGFPGSWRTSGQRLDAESCTRALVCVLQGRTGTRSSALGLFASHLYLASCQLVEDLSPWAGETLLEMKLELALLSHTCPLSCMWVFWFSLVFTGNYF